MGVERAAMFIAEPLRRTVWPRRGVAGVAGFAALYPLSALFGAGVGLRNLGYRTGLLAPRKARIPVVSVGNLAVGGTGKTPFTLWLAQRLEARGLRVGIVLRGYGGRRRAAVTVVSQGAGPLFSADDVGDEAVMLARSFRGVVIASARRIDGANMAAELGCQVVVLDDGFQHRALARACDLVLVDNRHRGLLPAGPLRERVSALRRADAVLEVHRGEEGRRLLKLPRAARGKPVFSVRIEPSCLIERRGKQFIQRPLGFLAGKRVVAVCGIGQPDAFYELIRQWEAEIAEIYEYRDHHRYTREDWQHIMQRGRQEHLIVTTEKDQVKLDAFPFPTGQLVALRIEPRVEREAELIELVMKRTGMKTGSRVAGGIRHADADEFTAAADLPDEHGEEHGT